MLDRKIARFMTANAGGAGAPSLQGGPSGRDRPASGGHAKGKPPKVVITACIRKLVVILNAMLKNNEPWQPRLAAATPE